MKIWNEPQKELDLIMLLFLSQKGSLDVKLILILGQNQKVRLSFSFENAMHERKLKSLDNLFKI